MRDRRQADDRGLWTRVSAMLASAGRSGQGRLFAAEGEVVMRSGSKIGYAVLLSVLLGLGGVGCTTQSSGTTPTTSAVVTPATSTTSVSASSATPTATNDDEAAIAAVRRFYSAFDEALKSRQTDSFRKTFLQACRVCTSDASVIDQAKTSGRTFQSAGTSVADVRVIGRPDATRRLLAASIASSRLVILDAAGKTVEDNPAATQVKNVSVYLKEGQWLVESVAG